VSQKRGIWPFRVATYSVYRVGKATATEELLTGTFRNAEHALRAALSSESIEVSPTSPATTLPPSGGADRSFRPDIEGLRAVAVALVVLFHAGVVPLAGGYVGVDVFFVLSGFLITGLLIRERLAFDSTSLPRFYARRVRRILPAATLVLVVTLLASYQWLGFLRANTIALDGQWTALFGANLHFALEGTQYLNNLAPPSPLQHYWSLAVEEQFYLIWPLLFLIIAGIGRGARLRVKLAVALGIIITASFAWSIIQTPQDGNWAFFSPLTRAWELAIGALLAVSIPLILRIPTSTGPWLSWAGLGCVIGSAFLLDGNTPFPGYAASLPVLGAALAIIGGTVTPGGGAEVVLARAPLQWLGKLSYGLYLWHWPLLIVSAQATGNAVSFPQSLGLVAIAVLLSVVTYRLAENPIRRSTVLQKRTFASVSLGVLCSGELGD
jgi:peptidoglycan/LPS O-acetylase OafA/YrhL